MAERIARRARLVRTSRLAARACRIAMVAIPVALVLAWALAPDILDRGRRSAGGAGLPWPLVFAELALLLLPALLAAGALRQLERLFGLYAAGARGVGPEAARHLNHFSAFLLAHAGAAPLAGAVLGALEGWTQGAAEGLLAVELSANQLGMILIAALLFALTRVMVEACGSAGR
jgi:hypothetical protein